MENINLANKPFGPGNGEYYKELSDQIYFESGSDKLEPSDQIIIDSISALTKNIPGLIFHIIGCADSIGTQSANLTLGLNRANNVRDYLVKKGIDSMSIEVITKGENTGSSELLENRTVKIIPDYNISLSGQNGFSKKNPIYRTLDNSLLGEELCFIGLYNKACEYNPIGSCDNFTPLRTDDLSIQGYHASEAVDFIDSISEKTNILYISESHLIGQHRMFVTALLKRLWHNGYRELFLEALSDQDKQLAARGYPLVTSGYYIRDPLFGQLVRSALAIGFTLYSFESKNDDSPEFREKVNSIIKRLYPERKGTEGNFLTPDGLEMTLDEGELTLSMREFELASNISDLLHQQKKGKALIFGGEGHNYKESCGRYIRTGDFLKNYFKLDFLSVVQHSFIDDKLKKYLPFASTILANLNKTYHSPSSYCPSNTLAPETDIEVLSYYDTSQVFPTQLITEFGLNMKEFKINIPSNLRASRKLLMVYYKNEPPELGVPAFISPIEKGQVSAYIWVPPGDYKYYIRDNFNIYFSDNFKISGS